MIRETLIEADKLFAKFDLDTVVVYPSDDHHCCMSCKTADDLAYVYAEDKNGGYDYNQFAFRTWASIHMVIASLYNPEDETSFKVDIERDCNSNPYLFKISSGRIKMNYFVQNYAFIENQADLKEMFAKKKFNLRKQMDSNANDMNELLVKDVIKLGGLTNEKFFRIKTYENNNYIYFGNENQSVDSGKINIGNIGGVNMWREDMYFSVDYFSAMYRGLADCDISVKFMPNQILMIGQTDNVIKVCGLRGKSI